MSAVSPSCIKSRHERSKGGRIDYRVQEEGRDRVDKGGRERDGLSGRSLKYPPPITTYLFLGIQTGPCLDQQICDVAVTFICSHHECSVAILYHEWA